MRQVFGWFVVGLVGCSGTTPSADPCPAKLVAFLDLDGDGFGGEQVGEVCALSEGEVDVAGDCDDDDPDVHPEAEERCNGLDDNCIDGPDEGLEDSRTWFADDDGDGFGAAFPAQFQCGKPGPAWADNDDDCDDTNPDVNPAATEICNGSIDDDCDFLEDDLDADLDATTQLTWFRDDDGDGFGTDAATLRACDQPSGYVDNNLDCADRDAARNPDATEVCNGRDDDCDAQVDDNDPSLDTSTQISFFVDADNDGWGAPGSSIFACEGGPGRADNDLDCNDAVAGLNLDDVDNDGFSTCDGDCDDSQSQISPDDVDGDGFTACDAVPDCAPSNPTIFPGASETPADGVDQDCDGADDCFRDLDRDGYGSTVVIGGATLQCIAPGEADNPDDCDDTDDRQTVPRPWYDDLDLDGFGIGSSVSFSCVPPYPESAPNADDCDDDDDTIYPGAPEICTDLIDQDCDGSLSCCELNECLTPQCFGNEVCCPNDVIAAPPSQLFDSTVGMLDYHQPLACSFAGGAGDLSFEFVAPAQGQYTFDTFGSTYDTTLYALDDCQGVELACNDDAGGGLQSEITLQLSIGQRVIIIVDGFAASTGAFVLNVQ
jgi:hypothetical protein